MIEIVRIQARHSNFSSMARAADQPADQPASQPACDGNFTGKLVMFKREPWFFTIFSNTS